MKDRKVPSLPNEEFSVEFGDINGTKLYEIPFTSQKNHRKLVSKKDK